MTDDKQGEQTVPAGEEVAEAADIADEEELDIEIERVTPRKKGGCGLFWTIVVIVVVVAGILFGLAKWEENRREVARKAREARDVQYASQEQGILASIEKAAQEAKQGNVEAAFGLMTAAEEKWGQMAGGASAAKDFDKSDYALARKQNLVDAMGSLANERAQAAKCAEEAAALEAQAKALAQKRDAINSRLRDKILELAKASASLDPGAGKQEGTGTEAAPAAANAPAAGK